MFYRLKRRLTIIYYRLHPKRRYIRTKPTKVTLGDIIKVNDEKHHVNSVGKYPENSHSEVKFYIGTYKLGDE